VGWVMQLVINEAVHQCYITTYLLQTLKCHALFLCVNIVGLISSHPAACNTLVKYACELAPSLYSDVMTKNMKLLVKDIELDLIHQHAKGILASSSISYLKTTQLRGSLFQDSCDNKAISSVFTKFYVEHTEPLAVLEKYKEKGQWCLGELLDGHEFLAIFPITPVSPVHNN
ncbi:uncharacterized protein BJ212DRAFT_1268969, partial [Suillus subaureus]